MFDRASSKVGFYDKTQNQHKGGADVIEPTQGIEQLCGRVDANNANDRGPRHAACAPLGHESTMIIVAVDDDCRHQAHDQSDLYRKISELVDSPIDVFQIRSARSVRLNSSIAPVRPAQIVIIKRTFGLHVGKTEGDKKVPELIRGLLKDHAEVERHAKGRNSQQAVGAPATKAKRIGRDRANITPVVETGIKKHQFSIADVAVLGDLWQLIKRR